MKEHPGQGRAGKAQGRAGRRQGERHERQGGVRWENRTREGVLAAWQNCGRTGVCGLGRDDQHCQDGLDWHTGGWEMRATHGNLHSRMLFDRYQPQTDGIVLGSQLGMLDLHPPPPPPSDLHLYFLPPGVPRLCAVWSGTTSWRRYLGVLSHICSRLTHIASARQLMRTRIDD